MRTSIPLLAMLLFASCTHPPPGVLTLAPAGMRTAGTCSAHPDGTLSMGAAATADATVYVDAGPVTITVTANAVSTARAAAVEVWFAGATVGRMRVSATEARPYAFHAQPRASGPTALRIGVSSEPEAAAATAALVDVAKVVITEP